MRVFLLFASLVAGSFAATAVAQTYPAKPIRVIDAYPAGGGTDIVARTIAPKFQESLGHGWVIDNRPGANGIIGAEAAARSAPDGYTLLMFATNFTIHPSIYRNLPFDITKAFAPVTQVANVPMMIIVHPTVPAKSMKELIALARAKKGQLNFASSGFGGIQHMAGELLNTSAGMKMTHIPYKGGAPSVTATLGGEADLTFAAIPVASPHIKSGKVRPIAVTTAKRARVLPDLPTIAESGLPGYEVTNVYGVLAPAGTPRDVVVKLQQEIARILQLSDVRDRLSNLGAEPVGNTPEQFAAHIQGEIVKWAKVVKSTGIELQPW